MMVGNEYAQPAGIRVSIVLDGEGKQERESMTVGKLFIKLVKE